MAVSGNSHYYPNQMRLAQTAGCAPKCANSSRHTYPARLLGRPWQVRATAGRLCSPACRSYSVVTRGLAPFAVGEVRRCARARAAEQATRLAIIGARFRRSPSHFVPWPGVQVDLPILPQSCFASPSFVIPSKELPLMHLCIRISAPELCSPGQGPFLCQCG
jgi:hypothetical protein